MVDKVFGTDFTNETTPTATSTISVNNGSQLVDVMLSNLHKALTQATISQAGTVELATDAETLLGSDSSRAMTPSNLNYVGIKSGWIPDINTWTYSSADSPTFIISVNANMTTLIGVGDRIKLTQTTAKYFIVTAVGSFSGGATLITVYGGTDYTLANATISSPYYSHQKVPFGFPTDPAKWTVTFSDTTNASQATPTANTWYNLGSLTLSVPIGAWRTYYELALEIQDSPVAAASRGFRCTLSTANNSESDAELTGTFTFSFPIITNGLARATVHREKVLVQTVKTSHYLNANVGVSTNYVAFRGDVIATTVKCVCAYL